MLRFPDPGDRSQVGPEFARLAGQLHARKASLGSGGGGIAGANRGVPVTPDGPRGLGDEAAIRVVVDRFDGEGR